MNYLDVYRKRVGLHGSTVREVQANTSIREMERVFHQAMGYVEATLNQSEPIEVILESTTNTLVMKGMFRHQSSIKSGDYISFRDQTWIIRGVNRHLMSPQAELYFCNQVLNFRNVPEGIPCYVNNTTYGSKGTVLAGDKFLELDAKTRIYIQRNPITETLYLGKRLMLSHRYVYRITEMEDTVFPGMFIVTCQLEETNDMDDFENNIAYNSNDPLPPADSNTGMSELQIIGEMQLKRKTSATYSLSSLVEGKWQVEGLDYVEILHEDDASITLQGLKSGWVTLSFQSTEGVVSIEILIC